MGFSAAIAKAGELSRRAISLAGARPRMVIPQGAVKAAATDRAHDAVIVLQRGANASTDLYLRPRLAGQAAPVTFADLDDDPAAALGPCAAPVVIICRYASKRWLDALEARAGDLARCAFFMDDDLPGMMADASLPPAARGKVAAHYGRHVDRLSALCGEVWVSTPVLAARYPQAGPRVIGPIPDFDPPAPSPDAERRVVYHGTDVHAAERRFVLEVARRLAHLSPDAVVEITGDEALRRAAAGQANVEIVAQQSWPDYRRSQAARTAAVSLAPLLPSLVNEARAPVKAFDAARLGAVGVYADAGPYRGFVRAGGDGVVCAMDADAWAAAIADLLADPARRRELAEGMRVRLAAAHRLSRVLPAPPPRDGA